MKSLQSIEKALRLVQAIIASSGLPVLSLARSPRPSLREMARSADYHHETLRRRLIDLGEREKEIQDALVTTFREEDTLCLIDPTYLRETEERLIVFAIPEEVSGKAIPIAWDYQDWEDMRENPPLSRNLMVEGAVRRLRNTMGHGFTLVADREFDSRRFRAKLRKMGIGYVIRLRANASPAEKGENEFFYHEKRYQEPWRLIARKEDNPVKAYRKRMRIERTFRDIKGLFGMRELLRKIRDPLVRKGLIVLLFLAWLLRLLQGLYALVKGLLSPNDPLVKSFKRHEISLINLALSLEMRELGRLRSPCAIVDYEESNATSSVCGGVECAR